VSVYTPSASTTSGRRTHADDAETLHVVRTLRRFRRKGARFDYSPWTRMGGRRPRPTRFRPGLAPRGRARDPRGPRSGYALRSVVPRAGPANPAGLCPGVGGRGPPKLTYRNGYPALTDYAASFLPGASPYYQILKDAVLYHMRTNGVRFLKFDGGSYTCDDTSHGHLPGPWPRRPCTSCSWISPARRAKWIPTSSSCVLGAALPVLGPARGHHLRVGSVHGGLGHLEHADALVPGTP